VWCPSTLTRDDVRHRFGVAAERVPFCYDSDRFTGAAGAPLPSGAPPVLLAVSRLVRHKDHATVIRAAARLTPRPRVRFIGQGPEAGALRRLAGDLQVDLELTDTWVPDEAIVAAYRSASVVVCPSTFEGFGLTPMEGLAMGRPVAASDIPVHREFLGDAVSWFPPGDAAALAGAVREALGRPVSAAPLGDLTIDACAARMLPRFRQLLG
jgi:glycosyltransferase involved in cell wall biosynthesis